MAHADTDSRSSRPELLLGILALVLYICTLAPGIVYGDSAKFHIHIHEGYLAFGVNDHPLYLFLGRLFSWLPCGTVAWRINLVSAVCAAGAVYLVSRTVRLVTKSWLAAIAAGCALAVSHTFWFHAVTPEVYSLHLFTIALQLYWLLQWRQQRRRRFLFLFFAVAYGLGFDHLLNVLNAPAFLCLILMTDAKTVIRGKDVAAGLAGFALGIAFFAGVFLVSLAGNSFTDAALEATALTHAEHMFSYPPMALLIFTMDYAKYLVYQFPGAGLLLGAWGLWSLRRSRAIFSTLLLMYLANVVFVINYHETDDVYALFLPSYLIFSIWIGCGVASVATALRARGVRQAAIAAAALLLLVALPVALYYVTPRLMAASDRHATGARNLPLRSDEHYYLWPPKNNCTSALDYGQQVCDQAKSNAVIIADNGSLARLILYQQQVKGRRPDIDVPRVEQDHILDTLRTTVGKRPTYIFSLEPDMYPISTISNRYQVVPSDNGLIHELLLPGPEPGGGGQ